MKSEVFDVLEEIEAAFDKLHLAAACDVVPTCLDEIALMEAGLAKLKKEIEHAGQAQAN